uniref:Uncharacterized protein n=1 Tax=Caenorhabditis japonica TaxID=281687 RepID=A0A8R1EF76_CAEJA
MMIVEKTKVLPRFEKQLAGSTWNNFAHLNQSMHTILSEIHSIPSKIIVQKPNLKSFADALSKFDDVKIAPLNFDSMLTSLGVLESTYDEKLIEVADFKKSVGQLQDLQFAISRKKRLLSKLLTSADLFFKSFFEGQLESETNG